jgi:predicted  nucleic acid-binding Zn-ribbon protein
MHFVDNVIIPQLKAISITYKAHRQKYNKMKVLLEEYKKQEKWVQSVVEQLELKWEKEQQQQANVHKQKSLTKLQQEYDHMFELQKNYMQKLTEIDDKISVLNKIQENNEEEIKSKCEDLKQELRNLREELRVLEKEKTSIKLKLRSIESKYNEAKDSFK